MPDRKPRDLFTEGHKRKFLVIVDESPEGETALYYAARRARRTGGGLALLFVIEPPEMSHWLGVMDTFRDEQYQKGPRRVPSSRAEAQDLGLRGHRA